MNNRVITLEKVFENVDKIKIFLGKAKGSKFPSYADVSRISGFLQRPHLLEMPLAKLETELKKYAGDRFDAKNNTLTDYQPGQVLHHRKLLSGYFREWTKQNGFSGLIKIDKFLKDKEFYSILRNKSLFKDKSFRGKEHGEWTHAIQWWCLVEQYKETPALSSIQPIDLFKQRESPLMRAEPNNQEWLWSFAFESNVFILSRALKSDDWMKKFPVLSQLIRGREAKGVVEFKSEIGNKF